MSGNLLLSQRLSRLADPAAQLIRNVRLAENAFAGYSFANGWVTCPDYIDPTARSTLPPLPVSGFSTDPQQALHLLLMEAAERYSAVHTGEELAFVDRTSNCSAFYPLVDWPREAIIEWTAATRLRDSAPVAVPAALTYLGYSSEHASSSEPTSTGGCASGQSLNDAVLRAVLEVIERDALSIWWYNRVPRPILAVHDQPQLDRIKDAFAREKRSLTLLDISNDLATPVVVAYSAGLDGQHIYFGSAADLTYSRAALRAAAEMLQFWFWGQIAAGPAERQAWLATESLHSQPWLQGCCETDNRLRAPEYSDRGSFLEALFSRGADPLAVDLTRPTIGIPAVRVFLPGTVDHARPFGSARLRDLPVQLGWIEQPRMDQERMPYGCPI